MNIVAAYPDKAWESGGIFQVFQSLSTFGIECMRLSEFNDDPGGTDLVIGFGYPKYLPDTDAPKAMVFCSPLLQAELANEIPILIDYLRMLKTGELKYLFVLDRSLAEALINCGHKGVCHLPVYDKRKIGNPSLSNLLLSKRRGAIYAGLPRKNKNIFSQLLASSLESSRTIVIDNEKVYKVLKSIRRKSHLIEHFDHLDDINMQAVCKTARYGIQVSVSESYCFFVYELACLGIPCIVSPTMHWYNSPRITSYCHVNNISCISEMCAVIRLMESLSEEEYMLLCTEVSALAWKQQMSAKRLCGRLFRKIKSELK